MTKKELGKFFRKKRETHGYSQASLAQKLGYSSSQFVSNWERGLSTPSILALRQLIRILHLDVEEVVDLLLQVSRTEMREALK